MSAEMQEAHNLAMAIIRELKSTLRQVAVAAKLPENSELITGLAPHVRKLADFAEAPIDMVLHCPMCGLQHVDVADMCPECPGGVCMCIRQQERWTNPPHRSHLCHGCGHIWRPADVPTNGVAAVKTHGKADSAIVKR